MPQTRPLTARAQQRLDTRAAVLRAAGETMRRLGFAATTIREIAQAAGTSTGTVMKYAKCKEELLYEVFHEDIEQIAKDVFEDLPKRPTLGEELVFIGTEFLRRYAAEPELYSDYLEHSLFARGEWGERFTAQAARVGRLIGQRFAESIARGEIPAATDVPASVTTFFSLYYFVLMIQVKGRFADVDAGVEQLTQLILHLYKGLSCKESS